MKIRGITVGTPIKPEKAIVRCDDMTEEEKAVARRNIGAIGNGEEIDLDGSQIKNAGAVHFKGVNEKEYFFRPFYDGDTRSGFRAYEKNAKTNDRIDVIITGVAKGTEDTDAVNKGQLDDAIAKCSPKAIYVTEANGLTSYTSTEISDHIKNGGVAYLYHGGKYIPITASEHYAFAYEISDEGYVDYYEIVGNSLIVVEHHFAKESWVEKQIEHSFDSIETGLDAIIDVQNEMLGIISFICVGEIYTAIPGMTWGEWCDSEYNTVGAEVYSGVVLFSGASICDENGTVQTGDMVIVAGGIYELN